MQSEFITKSLCIRLFYFIYVLAVAIFIRDIPNQFSEISVFRLNILDIQNYSKFGDPISFSVGALDISNFGWLKLENDWIFNAWPPGFILLMGLIVKIFGVKAPIIFILQFIIAILYSCVLFNTYRLLINRLPPLLSFIVPLSFFAFPVTRVFLLQPMGVSLGESFAIGFFMLAITYLYLSFEEKSIKYAFFVGILFALSAYFRSQFELIVIGLTIVSLIFLFKKIEKNHLKTIFFILIISHLVMMPWRVYHWIHNGLPVWVATPKGTAENSIKTSDYFNKNGGAFIVEGGGNLACRISPESCNDTNRAAYHFVKTFLTHPFEWYKVKLSILGKYWFSSTKNWTGIEYSSNLSDHISNLLFLFFIIITLFLYITQKKQLGSMVLVIRWVGFSVICVYGVIFSLVHYEVRYFYFPKIIGFYFFILAISFFIKNQINKLLKFPQKSSGLIK